MSKSLGAAICLLFASSPALAQTTTYTGSVNVDPTMWSGLGGFVGQVGTYRINWNFDADIVAHLQVNMSYRSNDYNWDGSSNGGNEWFVYALDRDIGQTGSDVFRIGWNPIQYNPWGGYTVYSDFTSGFEAYFASPYDTIFAGQTINYSFTITRLGPIPEATTWAMLIAGLGLAGGAMRVRRTKIAYAQI